MRDTDPLPEAEVPAILRGLSKPELGRRVNCNWPAREAASLPPSAEMSEAGSFAHKVLRCSERVFSKPGVFHDAMLGATL